MVLLFFLSAFISEVAGTIAGFGSSTLFLPLALLFTEYKTALVLVAFVHLFGNIGRIGFFRHALHKKIFIHFGLPSVVFSLLGALLVGYISQSILKGMLGVFLVFYSLLMFAKDSYKIKLTFLNAFIGGASSGFMAGLIGTGGSLRGAFLTGFGLSKEKYIATAAAIALSVDMTRIPIYFVGDFLEARLYWLIPVLFAIALLGSFTGKQIVDKIPMKQFKKVVLFSLLMIGLKFTYDWLVVLP